MASGFTSLLNKYIQLIEPDQGVKAGIKHLNLNQGHTEAGAGRARHFQQFHLPRPTREYFVEAMLP